MTTLEFLQRILPSSGYYAVLAIVQGNPKQGFHSTLQSVADACLSMDAKGVDTYYGIASFQTQASRKQDNVKALKAIPVDIDCGPGKPYQTQKEGLFDLFRFVKAYSLPMPMIVGSGGGIHAYWCLDKETTQEDWKVVALALRAAAAQALLHIDTGKTGDSACVLRPIGTHNYKLQLPREVRLFNPAADTTIEALKEKLAGFTITPHHKASTSPLLQALAVTTEYPPAQAGLIIDKCKQVRDIVAIKGNVDEPTWYALLGVAAYCEHPNDVANGWSSGHAEYSEGRTIRKMEQWKSGATGPTLCTKFRDLNPDGCKDCKLSGRITTPVRIGIRHDETIIDPDAPDEEAHMVGIPKPFVRTTDGIKVIIDGTEVDVCPFDVYPLGQGKDEHIGYEVSRFKWNRPLVGWSLLEVPVRDLAEGSRDFGKHLGDAGIVPSSKLQAVYMSMMLRSFMAELNKTKAATNLYSSMGWKEDFSEFVLGGTIYKKDTNNKLVKEPIGLSRNAPKHILNAYSSHGSAREWIDFTTLLNDKSLAYYRFVLGIAFGCPLWAFGGLGGVVVSLFGETGAGKTTIQNWVQSVYGNPAELLIPAVATQNATFSRLGVYNNLPATIDEMSVLPAKDTANFIYWASLGKDKPRLTMEAVERDTRKFSTMILGSTNMSLNAKLLSAKTENHALSMRLLELTIPRHPFFAENSDKGREIYSFLHSNYGTVGPMYIERLVSIGANKLRDMVTERLATFQSRYSVRFSGEERFWEHAIVLSDLGNEIARDMGLVSYDHTEGTRWVLDQVVPLRASVKEQDMDCFDVLGAFLNEHVGNSISVTHTGTNTPHFDLNRLPRDELLIRYNIFRKTPNEPFTSGVVYINRIFFYRWLTANGHDPKTMRQKLYDLGALAQPAGDKYYMGRDTGIKSGQIYVLGVNLSHPRLAGILNDAESNAGLSELKQVIK